jgi:hypothetical protein
MMAFLEPAKDPERPNHPVNKGRSMVPDQGVDHFESIRSVLVASVSGCSTGVPSSHRDRLVRYRFEKSRGGSGSLRSKEVHGPVRAIAQTVQTRRLGQARSMT